MTDLNIINLNQMSDDMFIKSIGSFIKHHRLERNLTQKSLSEQAGINRSTLYELELGRRCQLITLIQLLRTLDLLHVLKEFQIKNELSPIQLAELEMKKRKRATSKKTTKDKPKSDW